MKDTPFVHYWCDILNCDYLHQNFKNRLKLKQKGIFIENTFMLKYQNYFIKEIKE